MSEKVAQHNTVFVGGISWKADEVALKNFFNQIGTVLECKIIVDRSTGKSKGYGFVTFKDAETAEKVKKTSNLYFLGKTMNVGDAFRKAEPTARRPPQQLENVENLDVAGGYPMYHYGYQHYPYYFNYNYPQGYPPYGFPPPLYGGYPYDTPNYGPPPPQGWQSPHMAGVSGQLNGLIPPNVDAQNPNPNPNSSFNAISNSTSASISNSISNPNSNFNSNPNSNSSFSSNSNSNSSHNPVSINSAHYPPGVGVVEVGGMAVGVPHAALDGGFEVQALEESFEKLTMDRDRDRNRDRERGDKTNTIEQSPTEGVSGNAKTADGRDN